MLTDHLSGNALYGKALWQQVNAVTKSALANGALKSIPTHCETREFHFDDNTLARHSVNVQIRVVENLERKSKDIQQRAEQKPCQANIDKKSFNPFLPYDPELYVGELTPNYRCLLNKFNVMDHHILMVTTQFEPQQAPLNSEDFLAAQICLQAQEGLVFYNGGTAAGASVEHRHLQMIPLPLSPGELFPFHAPLNESLSSAVNSAAHADQPATSALPFAHRVIAADFCDSSDLDEQKSTADINCKNYYRLLAALNLTTMDDGTMAAHNMLMTRDYLWVIPRSKESHQGLAVNALGFAGTLLVKNQQQCHQLEKLGCMELLKAVTQGPFA